MYNFSVNAIRVINCVTLSGSKSAWFLANKRRYGPESTSTGSTRLSRPLVEIKDKNHIFAVRALKSCVVKIFRLWPMAVLCNTVTYYYSGEKHQFKVRRYAIIIIIRNSPSFSDFGRSEQVHRRIYNYIYLVFFIKPANPGPTK